MDTPDFFLNIAGGEDTAREVVAASLGISLEEFLAGLAAADATRDREN